MTLLKNKRATLKDVAKKAGVAVSTASEILNKKNKNNYSSDLLRKKVLKAARELNYERNIGYSIMVGQKVNIVGILFSQKRLIYSESYGNMMLLLIQQLKKELGCAVFAEAMEDDAAKNLKIVSKLVNTGCRSFIFCGYPVGAPEIGKLINQKEDVDYIGFCCESFEKNIRICLEHIYSKYCEYLQENGKKRFIVAMPKSHLNNFRPCWQSVLPELSEKDLKANHEFIIPDSEFHDYDCTDEMYKFGYEAAKSILAKKNDVQALIFLHDAYAAGAGKYLIEQGITVGKDILVFGRDNTTLARCSTFPVISSTFDIEKIVDLLVANLAGKKTLKIDLKPEIIW